MKWIVSSDHAGFSAKKSILEHLKSKALEVVEAGAVSADIPLDFPDAVDEAVAQFSENDMMILICGTGIGVSMRANRYDFLRAAVVYDDFIAKAAKEHNNANALCFGARTQQISDICRYIDIFKAATYEGGRHIKRLEKLNAPKLNAPKVK